MTSHSGISLKRLQEYTDTVTGYINKCIDDVTVVKNYQAACQSETGDARSLLRAHNAAFKSGDTAAYRLARRNLFRALERPLVTLFFQTITDYKSFALHAGWVVGLITDNGESACRTGVEKLTIHNLSLNVDKTKLVIEFTKQTLFSHATDH